jgi:hypothetical protein
VAIWYILWPFGIFYGYLIFFWYIVPKNRATLLTIQNVLTRGKFFHWDGSVATCDFSYQSEKVNTENMSSF